MLATSTKERTSRLMDEAGQAMVEFALVVVFLFVLFVCVLQMILLMHAYNTLADAAKEGVRYAIVHGTGAKTVNGGVGCSGPGLPSANPPIICPDVPGNKVISAVTNFAGLSFQNVTSVAVDYNPGGANGALCNKPGCMVRVTVQHTYTPLFGLGWPNFTLNAAADGRIMN